MDIINKAIKLNQNRLKKRVIQTLLVLVLFSMLGCKQTFLPIEEVAKQYEFDIPNQKNYPDDDAVVLLDKTDWTMKFGDRSLITKKKRHVIKKLFNNFSAHSIVKIPINKGDELYNISARIVKEDGTIFYVQEENIYSIEGTENGSFYSDKKFKKFTFPGIEKNCIIEFSYEMQVKNPFMWDVWLLQEEIPIVYCEYSLTIPKILLTEAKWNWYYKVYNDSDIEKPTGKRVNQLTDSDYDEQFCYKWEKKEIPSFKYEPKMPSGLSEIPHIKFRPGFWKNWNDISNWYYTKLFAPKLVESEKIINKAKAITKGLDNKEQQIKACYDFVKDLRYVSINLNNAGIVPTSPDIVLKNRFGDCKDKSILLISLLKALNIKAEPVLVLTKNEGKFDSNFASWNFNHMIVKVIADNKEIFWLDSTAKYVEIGDLPIMDQNIDVLVLHDDGTSTIEKTPDSSYNKNRQEIVVDIEILDNLTSKIMINYRSFGAMRTYMASIIKESSDKELEDFCLSLLNDDFLSAKIDSIKFSDLLGNQVFELNFIVSDAEVIQEQSSIYLVSYDFLPFITNLDWLLLKEREHPLIFSHKRKIYKEINIKYPNYLKLNSAPNSCKFGKNLISYFQKVDTNANIVKIQKELIIKDEFINKNEYKIVREIFEGIQKKNREQLILKK